MATIYQKTATDKTSIQAPREYFMRQFDFEDWTEMRMGFYISGVSSSDDNAGTSVENVSISTVADKIMVGIKNSDTVDLPGEAGSLFLGITTPDGFGSRCTTVRMGRVSSDDQLAAVGYNGASMIGGTTSESVTGLFFPVDPSVATGYCGLFAMKFVITNRGAASQSIAISTWSDDGIAGADYSASALGLDLNNAIYGTARNIAWNDGAAAYDIPDAFFVRVPFYSNRIRLSCIRMTRYAP